ncbi:DUF302 domain-containing protein [Ferroplasma sp.]|uniref:DUF302 domain-containing protein n=1 Tax=Ferroplasma sp. TaxID=2591003 RepID=UPI00307E18B7
MEKIISKQSKYNFEETIKVLKNYLESKDFKILCTIDHAEAAHKAGLNLENTVLLVFGNPKAGTLLMQDSRFMGLELPLKLLIYEENNKTKIAYFEIAEYDKFNLKEKDILKNIEILYNNIGKEIS